ncbi:MAG: sugar transferase [Hyphomicrobium sp.]
MRQLYSLLGDVVLVALATLMALLLRENFEFYPERFQSFIPYLLYTLALACIALPAFGTNRTVWRFSSMSDYLRILAATLFITGSAVVIGFSHNRLEGVARSLPIMQAVLILFFTIGARILVRVRHTPRVRRVQLSKESLTKPSETVLIVGLTRLTELYLRSLSEFAGGRIRVAGLLGRHERQIGRFVHQHKILGTPEDLENTLRALEVHGIFVNRIVVAADFSKLSLEARQALLNVEKSTDIKLDLLSESLLGLDKAAEPAARQVAGGDASTPEDVLMFRISEASTLPLQRRIYWRTKRAFDVVLALVLVFFLAPIILLVGILVAIDVGMPVTFWQQRPGLGGHPFSLYKFRTMAAAHDAVGHRLADADRVSSIGKFLRRTRLDELPQVYNVLAGEMSFVGPRPLLPVDQSAAYAARLQVRPGLTGWAQVQGGREISAIDKAALDIWYVNNASAWRDLQILAATVSTVIFGEKSNLTAIRRAWADLMADGTCQPGSVVGPVGPMGSFAVATKMPANPPA